MTTLGVFFVYFYSLLWRLRYIIFVKLAASPKWTTNLSKFERVLQRHLQGATQKQQMKPWRRQKQRTDHSKRVDPDAAWSMQANMLLCGVHMQQIVNRRSTLALSYQCENWCAVCEWGQTDMCVRFQTVLRLKDPAEVHAHAQVTVRCMILVNRMDATPVTLGVAFARQWKKLKQFQR